MKLSFAQKTLSYLYPVKIRKSAGEVNPLLELFLYKGQWQLATEDAIYSDGDRYRPLRLAFGKLKQYLPHIKNVLVLGTGLGSAVSIMDKMNIHPKIDLVEIDATILNWAKELLPEASLPRLEFICADANHFIRQNKKKYDLLIVDIFMSREVPDFVTEKEFLACCKSALAANGILVLNYIVADIESWNRFEELMTGIFSSCTVHPLGLNRILTAK